VARVPADIEAVLREIDAEVATVLQKWRDRDWLPSWLGLYRWTKPDGGEHIEVPWFHRHRLRYVVEGAPRLEGHTPRFYAMIGEDMALDPTSRHLMRLTVTGQRGRRTDKASRRAWHWLLAHEPSQHPGARNLVAANLDRDNKRAAEWARWQAEADAIGRRNPALRSVRAVAKLVKQNLGLADSGDTIRKRIK
jgi:hypothetical protein